MARHFWLRSVLAYTIGGSLSALLVGMVLGTIGHCLKPERAGNSAFYFVTLLALILAAREWKWIEFPLPERKQQAERVWVHRFGFVMASAMWGFHIGLGFATRVTYGGFWILVALTLALGDSTYGAVLMMFYWFGRALSVWVARSIWRGHGALEPQRLLNESAAYGQLVAIALLWDAAIALLFAIRT